MGKAQGACVNNPSSESKAARNQAMRVGNALALLAKVRTGYYNERRGPLRC